MKEYFAEGFVRELDFSGGWDVFWKLVCEIRYRRTRLKGQGVEDPLKKFERNYRHWELLRLADELQQQSTKTERARQRRFRRKRKA